MEFRPHYVNPQSPAGIERLGSRLDGIPRHYHVVRDGTGRDSFCYRGLDDEWPVVRANPTRRLERARPAAG